MVSGVASGELEARRRRSSGSEGTSALLTVTARGLGELMRELRGMETSAADDTAIGRFKTSDDATALLLEV
jgi:hypothetical protein